MTISAPQSDHAPYSNKQPSGFGAEPNCGELHRVGAGVKMWFALGACIASLGACSSTDPGEDRTLSGRPVTRSGGIATAGGLGVTGGLGVAGGSNLGAGGMLTSGTGGTDPNTCSDAEIVPELSRSPGNLLVLFDRSISMRMRFGDTGESRIEAVDRALREGLAPFVCPPDAVDGPVCNETLTVGALLFPTVGGDFFDCPAASNLVAGIDDPAQINWRPVSDFLTTWDTFWPQPLDSNLEIGTPIEVAFQQGAAALAAANLEGSMAVLFITDGESTCSTIKPVDPIVQAATWLSEGINTYVISVAEGQAAFNDQVANAGGTGTSLNPTDSQQLNDAIKGIIQETAVVSSCRTTLNGAEVIDTASACRLGTVTMEGATVPCDPQNGFQIISKTEMELFGIACDDLLAGKMLTATFPCGLLE